MSLLDALLYGYRTVRAATVDVTQRGALNFSSAFTVVDNAVTSATDIGLATTQAITTATINALTAVVLRLTSEDNALTGSQNNVTIGNVTMVRVTAAGAVTWTGIAADTGRRVVIVSAVGAGGLTLTHASGSSTATNRFALVGSANATLATNALALLVYDTTQGRWLLVARSS
jgi:hypothetical protein